jgi:NADH-quinone oxidoreductase subunit G
MDLITLTIDDRQIVVEKGKTVLQAAIEHGITVPYYCYHPGIGIDGSCRVCIVKIEKMPKLQTSCSTMCTDGMVVHTRTEEVALARAGVFEFLLINHPTARCATRVASARCKTSPIRSAPISAGLSSRGASS